LLLTVRHLLLAHRHLLLLAVRHLLLPVGHLLLLAHRHLLLSIRHLLLAHWHLLLAHWHLLMHHRHLLLLLRLCTLIRGKFFEINDFFLRTDLIELFDLVFCLHHRLRLGLPRLLVRLHHARKVALVLHDFGPLLVYRVRRNSQVHLLLHLWVPVLWSSHLDLSHDLHGRLQDLDWKRHAVSFPKLVPCFVLDEALQSVHNLDQLTLHARAERSQHGKLVWVHIHVVVFLLVEHRNVDQEVSFNFLERFASSFLPP